jgi:hypothetical protein
MRMKCEVKQQTISVITPFYRGNKYMHSLADILESNAERISATIQWLIINDSPDCPVDMTNITRNAYPLLETEVIRLPENGGIHHARIEGLKRASGDFVLFIDQDDQISPDFLRIMSRLMTEDVDIAVCNAWLEQEDSSMFPAFLKKADLDDVRNLAIYIRVRNPIRSPGQCLIRRSSIPEAWLLHPMKKNGSDDLLLWILMLCRKAVFAVTPDCLYTHKYTGSNLSDSSAQIKTSSMEVVDVLQSTGALTSRQLKDLKLSVEWAALRSAGQRPLFSLKFSRIIFTRISCKFRHLVSPRINRTSAS